MDYPWSKDDAGTETGSAEWYLSEGEDTTISNAVERGIAAIVLAISGAIIALGQAFQEGLSDIIGTLSDVRDLVAAFFQNPVTILEETARYSWEALTVGDWAFFGPFTFAMGVLAIAIAFYVWNILDPELPLVDQLLFWR